MKSLLSLKSINKGQLTLALCFTNIVAVLCSREYGLFASAPAYAIGSALQAMGAVGKGCLLLIRPLVVIAGSDGIAIFHGRHALNPGGRIGLHGFVII